MVNLTSRHVILSELEKFTSYELLVSSVTIRGTGLASMPVYNKTFEDGKYRYFKNVVRDNV